MFRGAVVMLISALLFGAMDEMRRPVLAPEDQAAVEAACSHYRQRAAPQDAERAVGFTGFLAQTCFSAWESIETAETTEREAARQLLSRIVLLHQTVEQMNADRARAAVRKTGYERALAAQPVTPTGEFLIAHNMGLMRAFDVWLDTGAEFSLASYR